jgi:hypothetical protein
MIETKSRSCEGWFQSGAIEVWSLWNHPPRDPLRDPAALLTQEGHFLNVSLFYPYLTSRRVMARRDHTIKITSHTASNGSA